MKQREGEVIHNFVVMEVAVVGLLVALRPSSEAVDAQVIVGANCTLDADHIADVPGAVVAVILRPGSSPRQSFTILG